MSNVTLPTTATAPQVTVHSAPKRRWLTVGVLSVLQLVENSEGGLINSLFPVIRADLGLTLGALGVLTSVGKFARMLLGPVWAMMGDRFGRKLILVVTAFTVAHSFTLIASAYNFAPNALWFPPLIETLIAISIVYMALENIVSAGTSRRWMIAFGFGLVHGFGFSFALRENLQFAGSHLLTSLVAFNLGVELGQVLVLLLLVPLLEVLFRFVVAERMGTIILSALVAHTGWHWTVERWERLRQFRFQWPGVSAGSVASAMRWLMWALILAGVVWVFRMLGERVKTGLRKL